MVDYEEPLSDELVRAFDDKLTMLMLFNENHGLVTSSEGVRVLEFLK